MKKYNTQCNRILEYMTLYGPITTAEAMTELGVYRLASRINDLKNQGYSIKKETVTSVNRFGEKVRFAQYSIEQYPEKITN